MKLSEPRNPRYPSLDMWRGFACVMVLINHSTFYHPISVEDSRHDQLAWLLVAIAKRLWIGVPIFFVISGYCISATVDSHRRKTRDVKTYFFRRFRRIFPPYWAAVLLSVIAVTLIDYVIMPGAITNTHPECLFRPWWYSTWQWLGNLSLTETWRNHCIGSGKALFLGQAWTLCYEEQFYAVTGLLLILTPRHFFASAAIITILVGIVMCAASQLGLPIEGFFFNGLWIQFALGVLVYYQINYAGKIHYWTGVLFLLIGIVYIGSNWSCLLEEEKNWTQSYFGAFVFALIMLALRPWDDILIRSPVLRPMQLCGVMCYSLYLVHVPVVTIMHGCFLYWRFPCDTLNPWITMPFYCSLAIVVSWGFHLVIERRFINSGVQSSCNNGVNLKSRPPLRPITPGSLSATV